MGTDSKCLRAGEHRYFVATTGHTSTRVWAVIVCTSCGEAQLKEFPMDTSDGHTAPVYFDMSNGQLVIQDNKKIERLSHGTNG